MAIFERISARRGNQVDLGVTFYDGGVPTDPYAILSVDIYKEKVLEPNKVATFVFSDPCDSSYPSPAEKVYETIPAGECGTGPQEGVEVPGAYKLLWDVPDDADAPNVYIDVWNFIPHNPCGLEDYETYCGSSQDCPDINDPIFKDLIISTCHRFWVYTDNWYTDDGLEEIRLGFEPLDQRFKQPEVRPLEIGITPLPLYDFNYNLNMPVIPNLIGTIQIKTQNNEVIVDDDPLSIGIRQGSYRTNPFVLRYMIDTTKFLIGTYKYRVTVKLPDGSTRTSDDFIITIS